MSKAKAASDLRTRALSAAVFGIIVLALIYLGGPLYALLIGVAVATGIYEWGRMVAHEKNVFWRYLALLFGICYIAVSGSTLIWLREQTGYGLYNTLTLLCIVWGSDISAYFTGRAIGGPKLAPEISPKKTWAGFAGSSVGAGLLTAALACPYVTEKFGVVPAGGLSPIGYGALGFGLAMVGQVGDLFISIFKRRYGIKDTGAIMPGHGGILDRIDALLLVAIAFSVIVAELPWQ